MKTTDYKKGDVVILSDGKHCEYLGEVPVYGGVVNAYKPLDGETEYAATKYGAGEFVPFPNKLAVEEVKRKWYQKICDWWKASNRWKHFLYAIPSGAVFGWGFTAGLALGMEVKDKLWGGKPDFIDYLLTCIGGLVGWGVMRLFGLDYLIMELVKLITL